MARGVVMKLKLLAAAFLTANLFFHGAPAHSATILINGGFETGSLAPWFASNDFPTVTNAEAHSGTFSVSAFSTDAIRQNFAPVSTASISEVSFWVKRVGGPFDFVQFFYSDGSDSNTLVDGIGQGDDWQFFDVTSALSPGKNLTGFEIFGTTTGPAFLDDFTITAADETNATPLPAALPLFAGGLGVIGLLAQRRKRRAAAIAA